MTVRDVVGVVEEFAPLSYQDGFDNCGLTAGDFNAHVTGVLLCVDVTENIVDEAIEKGANLIISHHPIIFHSLKQINGADFVQRIIYRSIRHGISLYAAHTNLDSAIGGLSFRDGEMLGLQNMQLLAPRGDQKETFGYGVVGELSENADVYDFLSQVKRVFKLGVLRHSEICKSSIRRVALSSGSGASLIPAAMEAGVDLFLAADFKYNDFFTPDGQIIIADIGHFESEYCAIDLLYDIITKKISTFVVHKSERSINPVNYLM